MSSSSPSHNVRNSSTTPPTNKMLWVLSAALLPVAIAISFMLALFLVVAVDEMRNDFFGYNDYSSSSPYSDYNDSYTYDDYLEDLERTEPFPYDDPAVGPTPPPNNSSNYKTSSIAF